MSLQDKKLKAEELIKDLSDSIDKRLVLIKEYLNSLSSGNYPDNWIPWLSKRFKGLEEAQIKLFEVQKRLDDINAEIASSELKKEKERINKEKIAADEVLNEKQLIKEAKAAEKEAKKAAKEAERVAQREAAELAVKIAEANAKKAEKEAIRAARISELNVILNAPSIDSGRSRHDKIVALNELHRLHEISSEEYKNKVIALRDLK